MAPHLLLFQRMAMAFAAFVLIVGCKKNKDDEPVAPVIEFKSISTTAVVQFQNQVAITFSYEDEQGDLGEPDPDKYSLSVKDSRLPNADWYHLPPMTPDLQRLHIKGTYTVHLNPLFLLGNGVQEAAYFTLQVTDRAGNRSNEIRTPTVIISQ